MSDRGLLWGARVCFFLAGLPLILATVLSDRACADTLDVLVVTSGVADLVTTEVALRRPGVVEGNPAMREPAARVALKGAAVAGVLGMTRHLEKHGHRRASKVFRILTVVGWSGVALHNVRAGR